jgi:phosphate transport system substrate-binding protein
MFFNSETLALPRRRPGRSWSLIALLGLIAGLLPTLAGGHAIAQANCQTFPQTKQQVCGKFLDYWNTHGGLAQQGYPITGEMQEKSAINGKTYTVQYFERAVFEAHPENQPPYDVLLQLLGVTFYKDRYGSAGAPNQTVSTTNAVAFPQTGHSLGGDFRTYWDSHGGLAQQGYPISDEFQEKNQTDGKTYTVQYFERAVFEAHPENQPPNNVLLSLLGTFTWNEKQTVVAHYPGGNGQGNLTGTGSTAVVPTMSKWATEYNKLYSGVKVNYQGTGSGNGRTQFLAKTVDFAGTDAFLSDKQFAQAGGPTAALHVPITMWGVTVPYNIPGVTTQLKMDGPTLANIFLLHITDWNDPAIAALNPGVTLPDLPIAVVHRSDGSGTTFNFTDYLNKVSPEWKSTVGSNTVVNWPGGIGGQGSDGVTQLVKQTEGAIGYVEVSYARQNNLPYFLLKNQAGNFVDATGANVGAAAQNLIDTSIPADLRYSVTNAPGANSYPIAATTWLLVYADQTQDPNKGALLAYFLWWASHDGQQYSDALGYAPLPPAIVLRVEDQIRHMNCGASRCFPQ